MSLTAATPKQALPTVGGATGPASSEQFPNRSPSGVRHFVSPPNFGAQSAALATVEIDKPCLETNVRPTVLVADDDVLLRMALVGAFSAAGMNVVGAANGTEALEMLRKDDSIAYIVSDVLMPPGLDGLALAREARIMRPGIGILLASGYAAHFSAAYQDFRQFDIIAKPYDPDTVARGVCSHLSRKTGG